jgi:DnaK suppressor protein
MAKSAGKSASKAKAKAQSKAQPKGPAKAVGKSASSAEATKESSRPKAGRKPVKAVRPPAKQTVKAKAVAPKPSVAVKKLSPQPGKVAASSIVSPRKAQAPLSAATSPAPKVTAPKVSATAPSPSTPVPSRGGKPMAKKPIDIASIKLPDTYRPSDDEPFMGPHHRAYFRLKLMKWKDDIIKETMETLHVLHEDTSQHPDLADRATSETDRALELRARDRQRKLIAKIDSALRRIEDGSYGYCEETGEPISLKRLDARPVATLSLEAQERHERRERVYRDE